MLLCFLMAATTGGPMVKLGAKVPACKAVAASPPTVSERYNSDRSPSSAMSSLYGAGCREQPPEPWCTAA